MPDKGTVGILTLLWAIFSVIYVMLKEVGGNKWRGMQESTYGACTGHISTCSYAASSLLWQAKTCSAGYWGLLFALYPILIVFTLVGAKYLLRDQARQQAQPAQGQG